MTHIKNILMIIAVFTMIGEIQAQKGGTPTVQAESRRSGRSNSDKCCQGIAFVISQGTSNTDLGVFDLFDQPATSDYMYVDMLADDKAIATKDYVSFSADDTKLNILMSKLCPPKCPKKLTLIFTKGNKTVSYNINNPMTSKPSVALKNNKQN
jgi:hypothetical protein